MFELYNALQVYAQGGWSTSNVTASMLCYFSLFKNYSYIVSKCSIPHRQTWHPSRTHSYEYDIEIIILASVKLCQVILKSLDAIKVKGWSSKNVHFKYTGIQLYHWCPCPQCQQHVAFTFAILSQMTSSFMAICHTF